ncbi:MAG TPA: L,D-transpeptidase family protein [Candidatus Binatia bacterium]|nr:L,D-transpeptidase family protein [Candidatus Binatia bacterium]
MMSLAVALSGIFFTASSRPAKAAEVGPTVSGGAAGTPAPDKDTDNDGLTDLQETTIYKTDPAIADTDSDGFPDGLEVRNGYSPRFGEGKRMIDVDSDKDYLNDAFEVAIGTDLLDPDTDGDLYLDGTEVAAGFEPLKAGPLKRDKLITVSLAQQRLTYYFGDAQLDTFLISSGVKKLPTPPGTYRVLDKVPVKHYGGRGFNFDLPNTKWNLHFTTRKYGYYIHGAYWHHNFGHPMSHGCINVAYKNMEALYDWAQVGTKVVIN